MLTRWLYTLIFYLAIPVLLFRLLQRARLNPGYRQRIGERFGLYSVPRQSGSLWLHTVSVGEFMAAQPLIGRLLAQYPDRPVLVTTMTPTGSERVRAAFAAEIASGRLVHVYLPYDLPDAINRFLRHFNPQILVVMETELWPNLIHFTHRRCIPILIANARLSEKSARGYRKVSLLTRPMLREIAVIAAQSEADGERFIELGLPPASLQVTGTVKFDLSVDEPLLQQAKDLRRQWGEQRKVFIAASTHEGEDEQVLEAFRLIHCERPDALLVLVPRHPERFEAVALLLERQGWQTARFSRSQPVTAETNVVLGDVMGQLLKLLAAADVAFIGGSLEPVGGHNMLEPLAVGTPAITGPHVFNFAVVAELLTGLGVLTTVTTPLGLGQAVLALFNDEAERQRLAQAGREVINRNRGALDRLLHHIHKLLQQSA